MSCSLAHLLSRLKYTKSQAPVTNRDLWALAGYTAFAGVLFAPLRHYVGTPKEVKRNKIEHDSFPISTYPMFSADRKGRVTVPHVVGITSDWQRIPLHYRHYGTGGLNQVRKQIARGVRRGDAAKIAQRYANSVAKSPRRNEVDVIRVLVVRSRFSFDDYFSTNAPSKLPIRESIHAQCEVGGTAELLEEKIA